MNRQRICTAGLILMIVAILVCGGHTPVKASKTVRVAMMNYPNFIEMDEDGNAIGYASEYLGDIAARTGWTYEYVPMNFSDAEAALAAGTIDIVPGTQFTEARAEKYNFGEYPMAADTNVLCTLATDDNYSYNDFAGFNGMRIAVLKNSIRAQQFSERINESGSQVQMKEYASGTACSDALKAGEVDAVLMAGIRCTPDYRIIASTNPCDLYFTTNPKDPSIKQALDEAQGAILEDNPYYNYVLNKKYYGDIPRAMALTAEEREYIKKSDVITVAINENLAPIEYYDNASNSFKGLTVEIFNNIAELTGLKFNYVKRGDTDAVKAAMSQGTVQVVGSIADDSGIASTLEVRLTDSIYDNTQTVVASSRVPDYTDTGLTVAYAANLPLFQNLLQDNGYTNLRAYPTLQDCVEAVHMGKVDMTIIPTLCIQSLLGKGYYAEFQTFTLPGSNQNYCIGIADQADTELYSIINKAVVAIPEDKRSAAIINSMATMETSTSPLEFIRQNRGMVTACGVAFLIGIILVMMVLARRRKMQNAQLAAAAQEAERANMAKSEFLSRMSHDIRTPMNAIIGFSDDTLTEDISHEELKNQVHKINESGQYLLALINDVLDMTKIDSHKMVLSYQPVSEQQLYDSIVPIITEAAKARNVNFVTEMPAFLPNATYQMDLHKMQEILLNLLSNAVKFTPEGKKVCLSNAKKQIEGNKEEWTVTVMDEGIGMSEDFQSRMFEAFEQEHETENGTGLGLAIVKSLVELMGGTIECTSTLGKGTTFTLHLTLEKELTSEETIVEDQQGDANADLSDHHVLVVEDHPINAQIATRLLERRGMTVDVAQNGQLGVDKVTEHPEGYYAAILMDIRMPVMDGLEATRAIRDLPRADAKTIPIIAMTANAFADDRQNSKDAGMDAHLAKPIEPDKLYSTLAKVFQTVHQS